jgi:integral membrane sensor domain MASE1
LSRNDIHRYFAVMEKALTMTGNEITETIAEAAKAGIKRVRERSDWTADVLRIFATAAAVYLISRIVNAAVVQQAGTLSAIWPAYGIALCALLLWGRRVWPGIYLALLAGCAEAQLPWVFNVFAPAGTTAALYAAAVMLCRANFDERLSSTRDVTLLILRGAAAPAALAGIWTAICLMVSGLLPYEGFWATASVYFAANTSGILVVAPVILLAASRRLTMPVEGLTQWTKATALFAATMAAAWVAFADVLPENLNQGALAYLPFPFLVAMALIYGLPAAALTNLGVIAVAVFSTTSGHGPFLGGTPLVNFGQIELFISIFTGTSLLIGAGSESRRREEQLRLRAIARESEIERIKAQIHPHFLFNCLGAIHSLVGTSPDTARQGVMHLSRLLRNSLDTSEEPLIPLSREFEIVNDFLKLQQMRFEEGLQVECRIFPNAASYLVPPMILQPLVENAVVHGREGGDTRVIVMAIANEKGLTIKVENTVDPASFTQPEEWIEGVGLRAARTRLEQAWPGRASITFHCDTPGWVTATLKVLPQ